MSQVISKIANRTSVKFYALVLGAALALTPVAALAAPSVHVDAQSTIDLDDDTVRDVEDNCIPRSGTEIDRLAAQNPRVRGVQTDTDGDGFGNRCDCDFDNNDVVGMADLGLFTQVAGAVDTDRWPGETPESDLDIAWGEEAYVGTILVTPELMDHTGDGRVNLADLNVLLDGWGGAPGPSAVGTAQ